MFYPLLGFADDLCIIASSARQAQEMLAELHATLQQAGMRLQPSKCAWLAINPKREDIGEVVIE